MGGGSVIKARGALGRAAVRAGEAGPSSSRAGRRGAELSVIWCRSGEPAIVLEDDGLRWVLVGRWGRTRDRRAGQKVFLSTRQVLQCQPAACQALPLLPIEFFPLLFKVAFKDKRTVVLQELVHTWPFSLLSFQQLLQEYAHCSCALLQEWPNTETIQAVILGLITRLYPHPPQEAQEAHAALLNMTGLLEDGVEQEPSTMSMWYCTAAVAHTCIVQQISTAPGLAPTPLEVHVELHVNRAFCSFLQEALQSSLSSPLRFCQDLQAEDLPINTVGQLQLLDSGYLRCMDLCFNSLGMRGCFQHLSILHLHYFHRDYRQLCVDGEDNSQYFLAQMGSFACLGELSMGSSLLSGLHQLLSTLQSPLESLELAFCALLPDNLRILAQSCHAAHLKKLDLSGNDLSGSQLESFHGFLQVAAAMPPHLVLSAKLAHTQQLATLSTLCTNLCYLGLYGNPLSVASCSGTQQPKQSVDPFPVDCHEGLPPPPASVLLEVSINKKFARVKAKLYQLLVSFGCAHMLWTTDIYDACLALYYFSL
ncbi:LOW QUALITY PROTEIN: leucine-rich repeat-containing protein 14 [Rhynchocyon petersi]